jgi:cytolysin-activating lysine-acyltransferase
MGQGLSKPTMNTEKRPLREGSSNMQLLGEVMWLMAHSSIHRQWPIESLMQWVTPALLYRQCRVYRRQGKPIAYVSWAYMSKEVEEAYVLNPSGLQPKDWKSGDRLWLLDVLAPFGGSRAIARDLKNGVFTNSVGRALRVKPGKDEMRIVYLHGANALEQSRDHSKSTTVDLAGATNARSVK